MVLHTIISEYDIFSSVGSATAMPEIFCKSASGRYFEYDRTPQGLFLRRIISTDPADYLNPAWQPGSRRQSGWRK